MGTRTPENLDEHSYEQGELNCMESYADAAADCAESFRKYFRNNDDTIKFVLEELLLTFKTATRSIDDKRKALGLPPCPKMK